MWISNKKFQQLLSVANIDLNLLERFERSMELAREHGLTLNNDSQMFSEGVRVGQSTVLTFVEEFDQKNGRPVTVSDIKDHLTYLVGTNPEGRWAKPWTTKDIIGKIAR